ncbi:MAG: hypothetical protein HYY85_07945 [Deltaproteobacteria bacterium]|nr:hypothetical protein [Deltaproteobacteria bacterium]
MKPALRPRLRGDGLIQIADREEGPYGPPPGPPGAPEPPAAFAGTEATGQDPIVTALQQLVAALTLELGGPLATLLGALTTLRAALPPEDPLLPQLLFVQEQADRIAGQLGRLRALRRYVTREVEGRTIVDLEAACAED